ncbi:hypothetical protein PGT21_004403 [Puccinia graminis f. sp. tritici]|uniref:Uncharacterized protein n=1 Tax=Puccinia graminis f. sp. tritici TaxID=56615 RepID=A0A5B0R0L8_PUCGR|nr:hypothetical protein PGT21_004403 [Puccinia graminis f. sp. tritici]KAA1118454.1 hypothetical protein PGTUg99_008013 [Puccinia graminis f. sp. tritici]
MSDLAHLACLLAKINRKAARKGYVATTRLHLKRRGPGGFSTPTYERSELYASDASSSQMIILSAHFAVNHCEALAAASRKRFSSKATFHSTMFFHLLGLE